jgi:ABC-2 type transport system ATP-binding protein
MIVVEDTPENLQARLVGAERIILRVRGETDELVGKLSKIKGVQNAKPNPDGTLEFQFLPAQDVRPLVAKTIIESGYDLLEMRPIGLSLEEIFLELTKEEQPDKKKKAPREVSHA